MRRIDASRPGPRPPSDEQLLIAALEKAGKSSLAAVPDLGRAHFMDPALGDTFEGLRRLAESGGQWDAGWAATWAQRVAESNALPPAGPRMPRRVHATPSELELEQWGRSLGAAEALHVATDFAAQVRATGMARPAEQEQFWPRLEEEGRRRGGRPCPHCASSIVTREPVDGFRDREHCGCCGQTWPARALEPEEVR